MPILQVSNLEKNFGSTRVLENISFNLEEGQSLSIIGRSGSGKTTLLRCLNFLEHPNGGKILVRGETIFDALEQKTYNETDLRQKRLHFGLVFQNFNLFPQYTALRNVTLALELLEKEREHLSSQSVAKRKKFLFSATSSEKNRAKQGVIQEMGMTLLTQMGLADRAGYYPHQLSGGQQQRVAIARSLALRPDILCFDEPTSALDPELTGEVLRVIRELAQQNTTMIIVTHEIDFAMDVADHVIFMDSGVIVEQGTAKDIIKQPHEERTRQFLSRYSSV